MEAFKIINKSKVGHLFHKCNVILQKLNTCVQRHVQESNEMGEALLHLSEETEQMRGLIKKLEESAETRFGEETLVADVNLEQKLWDLEKGKLLMDLETLTTERERAKRDSMEAYKNNEILKLENSKLKAEIQLLEKEANSQIEIGVMKDRINYLKGKYLRAESYRKALVWQKQYLMSSLNGYRSSEEAIWKRMGKLKNNKKKDTKSRGSRCKKFKIVALAVMVIFRLKYIVKRWKQLKPLNICSSQDSQSLSLKRKYCCLITSLLVTRSDKHFNIIAENVLESVISIYSEPINPLAYQTHNLFRPTSTRVLRTPPSRDPGLQNCTPDNETSDYSETFGLLQRNVSTAKVLP